MTRLVLWNFVFPTAQFFCGFSTKFFLTLIFWSDDREAEGGSLLRSYTPKGYRGFESPLLRSLICKKFLELILRPQLSWIERQIADLKAGGSNPLGLVFFNQQNIFIITFFLFNYYFLLVELCFGEMSEWSMVQSWKGCVPKGTGGSNPPLSVY